MATRMSQLKIDELSGVDRPAHEVPGWIVAKSADWKSEVDEFERQIVGTYDGLASGDADLYFQDAPDEVQKARALLIDHMSDDMEDDGEEIEMRDDTPASEEIEREETPARKSIKDRVADMFGGTVQKDEEPTGGSGEPEAEAETPEAEGETSEPEAEAETPEPEAETEPEAEAETPEPEGETTGEPELTQKSADSIVERVTKALGDLVGDHVSDAVGRVVEDELAPLQKAQETDREVLVAALDRLENIEKHLAAPTSISGQETGYEEGDGEETLSKAIHGALRTGRVELE